MGVASLSWSAFLLHNGASLDRLYFGTDVRLVEFVTGALLAIAWSRRTHRVPQGRAGTAASWLGCRGTRTDVGVVGDRERPRPGPVPRRTRRLLGPHCFRHRCGAPAVGTGSIPPRPTGTGLDRRRFLRRLPDALPDPPRARVAHPALANRSVRHRAPAHVAHGCGIERDSSSARFGMPSASPGHAPGWPFPPRWCWRSSSRWSRRRPRPAPPLTTSRTYPDNSTRRWRSSPRRPRPPPRHASRSSAIRPRS